MDFARQSVDGQYPRIKMRAKVYFKVRRVTGMCLKPPDKPAGSPRGKDCMDDCACEQWSWPGGRAPGKVRVRSGNGVIRPMNMIAFRTDREGSPAVHPGVTAASATAMRQVLRPEALAS